MVALLSVIMLVAAAMSVDLGNAWVRKRQLQGQADLAALSAGDLLPATAANKDAITNRVASYLNKPENRVLGQPLAVSALLGDGIAANGEVTFSSDGAQLTVLAPQATVDFALAPVVGIDQVDLNASATVGVYSEVPQDVLPFILPSGCPYGPADADTANSGGVASSTTGAASPGSGVNGSPRSFNATAQPDSANRYEDKKTINFRVTGVRSFTSSKAPMVQFEKRDDTSKRWALPGTWTSASGDQVWTFSIIIGARDVTALQGQWSYQTSATTKQSTTVYSQVENFNVQPSNAAPPPTPTVNCQGSARANFGQLDSPRNPALIDQKTNLAVNIAEGLDHQLTPMVIAVADECGNPARPGERLDNVSREGNNCVLPDSGNDGPALSNGLIRGVGGFRGRLDSARGATRSGCNGGNASVAGTNVNNDLLSCYLIDTTTRLADLAVATPAGGFPRSLLDPAVTDSPRFVWLVEVYRADRSSKNYQPIRRFVPGFITDETLASTRTSPTATSENGIVCNDNRPQCTSVSALKVFTFNPDLLPVDYRSPVATYDPAIGRKLVRLVR